MYSFASISILALCCYTFLLAAFMAARKTPIGNAFIMALISGVLWTGGSFCMRTQLFPGVNFWYQVSLTGMLLICFAFCWFLMEFTDHRNVFLKRLWFILMAGISVVNIFTDFFLKAPEAVESGNGEVVFIYHITWTVVFMFIACCSIGGHMFILMGRYYFDNSFKRQQMKPLMIGVAVVFGCLILWTLPAFKGFPIDIMSALFMVICMMFTLYKRRLFKLTFLFSRESCYFISILVSFGLMFYFLKPLERLLVFILGDGSTKIIMALCLIYAVFTVLLYLGMKSFINNVFIKDEIARGNVLREFSMTVSNTLNVEDILDRLVNVIDDTIPVNDIFVFIRSDDDRNYNIAYSLSPLSERSAVISAANPIVDQLINNDECILMDEFRCLTVYKSMWESEKTQLEQLGTACFIALKDEQELVGIVAVSGKKDRSRFTYDDISFLDSVGSVCSIAVKNSRLYEKAWYEARIDELTGLLNRKYFYEILDKEFEKNRNQSLSLVLINLDDFKLYNQIYGDKQGDAALKKVGEILKATVGKSGYVARCSGKEFAIILPMFDTLGARRITDAVLQQISVMNKSVDDDADYSTRVLTASCGICTAPYGASSARELLDNADMAVYQVKRNGKNGILATTSSSVTGGTDPEKEKLDKSSLYKEYAATIYALTAAIDTKDHYTFNHSENVEYYARTLAENLDLNEESVEIVREAALLHDVGKIGIAEEILNKRTGLTDKEFEIMKGHVMNSVGIIRHLPSLDYVIPAVISHHERWDGRGYPRNLKGEEIPYFGRILCIADAFDAMISKRAYKEAFPVGYALDEIRNNAGTQFDPVLAEVFIRLVEEEVIKPRVPQQN